MQLDGREIETAWWGEPPDAAPTLVLLHEGLGSVGLWRDVPAAWAAATGCGVFAYSRLGYGRSSPTPLPRPLDYMHAEAQQALPRVLNAAGIRRCLLVGHSDGGSIAAIYAGSVQDFRVRGLVLIAPHFFVEDVALASIARARRDYEQGGLNSRLARHHDDVEGAFRGWNDAWLDPGFRAFDLTSELAHIRVPVLLLQGADDPYGTEEQLRTAEREITAPVETLLVARAGHAPHFDAKERVTAAIADFSERLFGVREAWIEASSLLNSERAGTTPGLHAIPTSPDDASMTTKKTAPETAARPRKPRTRSRVAGEAKRDPDLRGLAHQALAGQVLIAMPSLSDPRFAQSVIYVCAHTDEGAMGIVVNRPLATPSFDDLLRQLKVEPVPPARTIGLCGGGPVENSRGFVLHSADWRAETSLRVDETVALTASLDILKAIAEGGGPKAAILALGYAGWGAGQLDRELQENAWLIAPADGALLFDAAHETKWRRALAKLRIDPALLSAAAGHA